MPFGIRPSEKDDGKPEEIQKAFIGSSVFPFQAPDEMDGDEKENRRFYPMIDFLCDAENYFGMTEQDFARWDDKVLLILSEDDTTFNQACKDSLIAIMPHPAVVTNLTGGHLALMVRLEQYAKLVTEYIQKRT